MKQAALEIKMFCLKQNDDIDSDVDAEGTGVDTLASFDGTWQKRGYASLNGVVTTMSSQCKCLDAEIMSRKCQGLPMLEGEGGNIPFY